MGALNRWDRLALLGGLLLAGCGVTAGPEVPLPAVPALVVSAQGETLALAGRAENWPAGRVAPLFRQPSASGGAQPIGKIGEDGFFEAVLAGPPQDLSDPEAVLLPLPDSRAPEGTTCSADTVQVSVAGARVGGSDGLYPGALSGEASLRPQLSPVVPPSQLLRMTFEGSGADAAARLTQLVYAQQDLELTGQRRCTGTFFSPYGPGGGWTQVVSVRVALKKGWNTVVQIRQGYTAPHDHSVLSLVVQGRAVGETDRWTWNQGSSF